MELKKFNKDSLILKPISERKNDFDVSSIKDLKDHKITGKNEKWKEVATRIKQAKTYNSSIILMIGAHVIRSGVQNYIIDLMKRGYISCLAMNGAGLIHDFELALVGGTTESVAKYIKDGQFGLWKETGRINDIVNIAYKKDRNKSMGQTIGETIVKEGFPYKHISLLAAGYQMDIPVTIHISIGCDIIHEHPNFDGAAAGALSYNDFLIYTSYIENLEKGVIMNFGSAIMAPEVYLKALSMARNVIKQKGKEIKHFFSLVCDIRQLPDNFFDEPPKNDPDYYFRPRKTMLIRTVADGGESLYINGLHAETVPALWDAIVNE